LERTNKNPVTMKTCTTLLTTLMLMLSVTAFSQVADDYCETATPICDFNGYYGNTSATYTPVVSPSNSADEDDTPLGTVFCGSIENNSWLQFMAADNLAELYVDTYNCSSDLGIQMEVYESTDCYNFSSVSNCENTGSETDFSVYASPLTPGSIYYLMIDGQAGDVCEYTITAIEGVFVADAGADVTICMGEATQLQAAGGTTYTWSPTTGLDNPNVSNPNASPTTTTTYTVTVSGVNPWCPGATDEVVVTVDDCGCVTNAGPDVNVCGLVLPNMAATTVAGDYNLFWSCPSGGVSYGNINSPTTSVTVTTPGTYIFTWHVTNAAGSTCTDNVTIKFDQIPTSPFTTTNVLCYDDNSTITYTGNATGGATYTWDFGGGTVVSGSGQGPYQINWGTAGNHTITLQVSENGCTSTTTSQIINTPSELITSVVPDDVDCASGTTGSVSVNVSGGTGSPTYTWSNGTGGPFPAGSYTVTITDANGCQNIEAFDITDPNSFVIVPSYTNLDCWHDNSGTASVAVSGATPPYTYAWPGGSSVTNSATGLAAGTHVVTITDFNGCTITQGITLSEPPLLTASITAHTDATCNGVCDGTATALGAGGTAPYNYSWSDGDATQTATGLCLGTVFVTVTDANGCTATASVLIAEPSAVTASISGTDISCFGGNDGTISVIASGGEIPFSYLWSPSAASTPNLTNLSAGTYNVTVYDDNNCSATQNITLIEPATPVTTIISGTDLDCNGDNSGTVSLTVNGGTFPYSFFWNNFMTSEDMSFLPAGSYFVTVTDANGCNAYSNVTIDEPPALGISVSSNVWICMGQTSVITASATGGVPPYQYYWNGNPGSASMSVNPTETTNYTVYVVDASGCIGPTKTITVNVYPPLWIDASPESTDICPGDASQITVAYGGGDGGPYYVGLDDVFISSPPFTVTPISNTSYVVSINDMCGTATAYDTVQVLVNEVPSSVFNANTLAGCEPYPVQFTILNPDEQNEYEWDYGDGYIDYDGSLLSPTHTYEHDGTFTVSLTATSPEGCVSQTVYTDMITIYPLPDAYFIADPTMTSIINPDIFFENLSTNTHISWWDFGDGDSSNITSPLHYYSDTGTFNVSLEIYTEHGCSDTAYGQIFIEEEFTFYAPDAFTPNQDFINDYFYFSGRGIDPEFFHLYIYDRWGEIIFETDKYSLEDPRTYGWNGIAKDHKLVPSGVYTWLVKFRDLRGIYYEKAGGVTLIR